MCSNRAHPYPVVRSLFKGIMPYKAFQKNDKWCVYKLDSSDNQTGKSLGCHASKDKANAQVRALYASEKKEVDMENNEKARDIPVEERNPVIEDRYITEEDLQKYPRNITRQELEEWAENVDDKKELYADYYDGGKVYDTDDWVPYNVTSLEQLDEVKTARKIAHETKEETENFKAIVDNISRSDMIEDKPNQIMLLAKEFVSRLRAKTSSINDFFNKPKKMEDEESKELDFDTPFMVFKDKDGSLKWISRYSNNCRDQDNPPEIIAKESHIYFEEMVDKGLAPMPELWVWHMPLRLGVAEVVTFDKDNGIAIAAGTFDDNDNAKEFAQLLADNPGEWGVSHGMPGKFIERSKEDSSVITKHITKEISVLPKWAAANKWADFQVLKEVDMTIKQEKRVKLNELGASDELLDGLDNGNKELAEQFDELNIERKEASDEEVVVEDKEATEEVIQETADKKEAEPVEETEEKEQEGTLRDELAEVFKELGTVIAGLNQRLDNLEKAQEEVEDKGIPEEVEDMPAMSLKEFLISTMATNKENSVTKSNEAIIDGRTILAKEGPEETQPTRQNIVSFGDALMEGVITDIALGNEQQPA